MIDTKLLSDLCKKSHKTITKWAAKNGVGKSGYRWNFTPNDCRKLFEYYDVDINSLPSAVQMNLFTDELPDLPGVEANESRNEPNVTANEPRNEFSESSELANELVEALLASYKERIKELEKQVEKKDTEIERLTILSQTLADANRADAVSKAMLSANEDKEMLLVDAETNDVQEEKKEEGLLQKISRFFTG